MPRLPTAPRVESAYLCRGACASAGIHTGEVVMTGDDVTGVAVRVGARIQATAESSCSGSTRSRDVQPQRHADFVTALTDACLSRSGMCGDRAVAEGLSQKGLP